MAVLMNQRTVWTQRRGSVTLWAWVVSIAVHLIVLTTLGVVKFSQPKAVGKQQPVPTAKVSRIKKLIETAPVIPKPKVKKPFVKRSAKSMSRLLTTNQVFNAAKPRSQDLGNWAKPSASAGVFSASSEISPKGIEFFGSWTQKRKVCYVVDCSGSMQGIFGRVRGKLAESIQSLQPDQYFYIIFFGGNRLFEFGDGRLLRATQQGKSAAYDFIDSIQPAGQTNTLAALERAVQIRDSSAHSPSIIYFLTDGFELTDEDELRLPQKIANLLKRFAPKTKINTIGFDTAGDDRKMLKTIARQSGGEFIFVTDSDN